MGPTKSSGIILYYNIPPGVELSHLVNGVCEVLLGGAPLALGDPGVRHRLVHAQTLLRVHAQHLPDQVLGLWDLYRVTRLVGYYLRLTQFKKFRQVVGRYCSSLLPRQDDGPYQIQVCRRFLPIARLVALYLHLRLQVNLTKPGLILKGW